MFTYVLGTFAAMVEDECGVPHLVIRTWGLEGEDPPGVAEAVGFEDLVSTNEGEWDGCKFIEYRFRQNAQ